MSWLLYIPYLAVVLPTVLIFLQILCNGHFSVDSFNFVDTSPYDKRLVQDGYIREIIKIPVPDCPYESVLHSWLVLPEKAKTNQKLPIVVMSHGIGAQKDMGLMNYAKMFADAGYAVLIFDSRFFGGSYSMKQQLPWRNFIYPWNHKNDITAVVDFIKKGSLGSQVDAEQIVLWGTSMAGGHVLTAAHALKPNAIRGVISQVAHLDGKAATQRAIAQRGVVGTIRVLSLAFADFVMSQLLGFSPIYIKIAGTANETAYMSLSNEDLKLYYSKHPTRYLGGWKNLAPARTIGILSLYNPKTVVKDIAAPILFIAARNDTLCPAEAIRQAAAVVMDKTNSAIVEVDGGHFDVYQGEAFDKATASMLAFLAKVVTLK